MMTDNTIILRLPEEYLKIHVHSLCQIAAKYGVADKVFINHSKPGVIVLKVPRAVKEAILREHFNATCELLAKHLHNHLEIIEKEGHFEPPALIKLKMPKRKRCVISPCFKLIKGAAL